MVVGAGRHGSRLRSGQLMTETAAPVSMKLSGTFAVAPGNANSTNGRPTGTDGRPLTGRFRSRNSRANRIVVEPFIGMHDGADHDARRVRTQEPGSLRTHRGRVVAGRNHLSR